MDNRIMNLAAQITVMLLGALGIGKTAAVNDFAKKIGADLVDVRLSAETPGSFEGKDHISPETGDLKKARAWWLKRIDENAKKADIELENYIIKAKMMSLRFFSLTNTPMHRTLYSSLRIHPLTSADCTELLLITS